MTAIELMPIAQFPGDAELGLRRRLPVRRPALLRRARRAASSGRRRPPRRDSGRPRRGLQPPRTRGQRPRPVRPLLHRPLPHAVGRRYQFRRSRTATRCARFFIDSALMWLEECRIDGFRLDAIHEIFDTEGTHSSPSWPTRSTLTRPSWGGRPSSSPRAICNDSKVVLPRDPDGYGLDAQWADDFCHALEVQLVGQASPYAEEYGDVRPSGQGAAPGLRLHGRVRRIPAAALWTPTAAGAARSVRRLHPEPRSGRQPSRWRAAQSPHHIPAAEARRGDRPPLPVRPPDLHGRGVRGDRTRFSISQTTKIPHWWKPCARDARRPSHSGRPMTRSRIRRTSSPSSAPGCSRSFTAKGSTRRSMPSTASCSPYAAPSRR